MAVNSLVRGAAALLILVAASTTAARAAQDRFVVDLASEPSTLDPHIQWNPDSYFVYRNIFDNLLTRDDKGAIGRTSASTTDRNLPQKMSSSASSGSLILNSEALS